MQYIDAEAICVLFVAEGSVTCDQNTVEKQTQVDKANTPFVCEVLGNK